MRITCFAIILNLLTFENIFAAEKPVPLHSEEYYSTIDKTLSMEALEKAAKLREETIESIKVLLQEKTLLEAQRLELFIRLGQLYTEQHDFLRHKELQEFEKNYDRWQAEKSQQPEPTASFTRSVSALTKAAIAYKDLLATFPNSPRTMNVTFALAKTLARLGKNEATEVFEKFIRKYPQSEFITDAHLALGEFYFNKDKIELALNAYQHAVQNENHPAYSYALFKLAWCYYNKTNSSENDLQLSLQKALQTFQLVVKLADQNKAAAIPLRDEAIQDLIMVYADLGEVEPAWQYFKGLKEEAAFYQMLERLAFMLDEKGMNDKAAPLFTKLLQEAPTRRNNPNVHLQLVQIYSKSLNLSAMLEALKALAKNYGPNSVWLSAQGDPTEQSAVLKTTQEKISRTLHRLGTVYHDTGLKSKNKDYLQVAASIYDLFLNTFTEHPLKDELRYYLADIQYELGSYLASADNFFIVAQSDHKNNKWRKDASLNAIYALNEWQKIQEKNPAPSAKMLATHLYFLTTFPQEKETLGVKSNLAGLYVTLKDYKNANILLKDILNNYTNSKEALAALNQIFTNYTLQQDWQGLDDTLKEFTKSGLSENKNLKNSMLTLTKQALSQRALAHEQNSLYAQAAEQYLRLFNQFKNDPNLIDESEKFLYNVNVNFYKAGLVEDAIATGLTLEKSYPQSKLLREILLDLSTSYEGLAQFNKAAEYNHKFASKYPRNKKAPLALYNAAVIYKNLKNVAAFETVALKMVQQYPEHDLAKDIFWQLGTHFQEQGKLDAAANIYAMFAKQNTKLLPAEHLHLQAKLLQLKLAQASPDSSLTKEINNFRQLLLKPENADAEKARCVLAKTLFDNNENKFTHFINLKLEDRKNIEALAKRKQNHLVQTAAEYRNVVSLGCAEFVVASSYRLGEMHENFAKDLMTAPYPENLNDDAVLEYKAEMEKIANPLKDEAYQFFVAAFKAGQDAKAFSSWTQKSFAKMQALEPDKHSPIFEQSTKPKYYSQTLEVKYVR